MKDLIEIAKEILNERAVNFDEQFTLKWYLLIYQFGCHEN